MMSTADRMKLQSFVEALLEHGSSGAEIEETVQEFVEDWEREESEDA